MQTSDDLRLRAVSLFLENPWERTQNKLTCKRDCERDLRAAMPILVPRGRAPFGQHQESRPLAKSNTGSPRFTDFPSLCACSESSLTNLIGSGLNLLCFQSHSKTECRWTGPEVAILGADQKERGLWGREWAMPRAASSVGVGRRVKRETALVSYNDLMLLSQVTSMTPRPLLNIVGFLCKAGVRISRVY